MSATSNNTPPEHLRLAAYWAATTVASAQDTQLASLHAQIASASTALNSHVAEDVNEQARQALEVRAREQQQISNDIRRPCAQLDRALALTAALEANIGELEAALSKAESAVGLTLGGRLSQLARGGGPGGGVPYLRQWQGAVPKVLDPGEYL
ncbi:hypothetical protein H4S07_000220 [Coemansia furcata]|uniref:Uncharacterized protein n=1 Tax=Coemansia furcata TaxID=417177 RepID=A0ACC1LRZ9_9FUNG|nr:hypothetical protein H4S07_000220 [Coemansia furcata]